MGALDDLIRNTYTNSTDRAAIVAELDELRRAKRLRDEAIAALRGDLARHAHKTAACHSFKADVCRAALRYLGADNESSGLVSPGSECAAPSAPPSPVGAPKNRRYSNDGG